MSKEIAASPPTIGLLVRRIDRNDYDIELWKAAYDLAREQACNLLLIAGHSSFAFDPHDRARSAVYRMLNPQLLDGVILSQTVPLWQRPEQVEQLAHELPHLPIVTTSIKVGDLPCVLVDNAPGLRALMRHLIEVHRCRRIVHVRGPQGNLEAQWREEVWRDELQRAGVTPEDRWLVRGHYQKEELDRIGYTVMEQTGGQFDAVVACNDTAAFRILEDFRAQGILVPADFAVCGFDDTVYGQFSRPSLTTVKQPTQEQLRCAWQQLVLRLRTKTDSPDQTVETGLVVRSSCGCGPSAWSAQAFPLVESILERAAQAGSLDAFAGDPRHDLVATATFNFAESAAAQERVRILSDFDRAMNQVTETGQLIQTLHHWLPQLGIERFGLLATCTDTGVLRPVRSQERPQILLPDLPEFFRVLTTRPLASFGVHEVIRGLELNLDPWFRLIRPFTLGTFPLVMTEVWYGLAFLEVSRESGFLERAIQEQIASVFHRLALEKAFLDKNLEERTRTLLQTEKTTTLRRLVSEVAHEINTPLGAIISSNASLEIGLKEVAGDAPEFFRTLSPEARLLYDELFQYHAQAHQRPTAQEGRDLRKSLAAVLENCGLQDPAKAAEELVVLGWQGTEQQLRERAKIPQFEFVVARLGRIDDLMTSSQIIAKASEKVSQFVSKLRSTILTSGSQELSHADLRESLEAALMVIQDEIPTGIQIEWDWPQATTAICRPEELQNVWIPVLRNALQASGTHGSIRLTSRMEEPWVRVSVADNGEGTQEETRSLWFTPFFTQQPGTNELESARRIVEGAGGILNFESRPGETVFNVRLIPFES